MWHDMAAGCVGHTSPQHTQVGLGIGMRMRVKAVEVGRAVGNALDDGGGGPRVGVAENFVCVFLVYRRPQLILKII